MKPSQEGRHLPTHLSNKCFGIDFSLTSPAVCVIHPYDVDIPFVPLSHCEIFYFAKTARQATCNHPAFHPHTYPPYLNDLGRFQSLAEWVVECIGDTRSGAIEGYAFAANGQITRIAESTGILKFLLHQKDIALDAYAPAQIKKFATGKGRADKSQMAFSFGTIHGDGEQPFDLANVLNCRLDASPCSDIVDAYFIASLNRILTTLNDQDLEPEVPPKPKAKRRKS